MTQQEQQQVKTLFVAMAMYYGHEIPDPALRLYVDDLDDLSFVEVAHALKEIRRDPKITRCPLPAAVRGRIQPVLNPESEAAIIANQIVGAIGGVGPYQIPDLPEVAKEIIRMEGGWMQVCEMVTNDNLPMFKAQWRGLAKSLLESRRCRPSGPAISDQRSADVQKLLGSITKEMPKAEETV